MVPRHARARTSPPFTPASDTGCSPTQRARTAQPAGHSVQCVVFAVIGPRAGRGIPGQFSDQSAESRISRQGAGVNATPTAEPAINLNCCSSCRHLWQSMQLCSSLLSRWHVDARVHRHRLPRVPADAVLAMRRQLVARPDRAMALLALQLPELHMRRVGEEHVLRLLRVRASTAARDSASRTAR